MRDTRTQNHFADVVSLAERINNHTCIRLNNLDMAIKHA